MLHYAEVFVLIQGLPPRLSGTVDTSKPQLLAYYRSLGGQEQQTGAGRQTDGRADRQTDRLLPVAGRPGAADSCGQTDSQTDYYR
jgi:hypothetical protein